MDNFLDWDPDPRSEPSGSGVALFAARGVATIFLSATVLTGVILGQAVRRVIDVGSLSRREAQVALCCAQGLTNAEIGIRLQVSEQTVKFHLRNIFVKFGVKRRAELVSRLFREGNVSERL